MKFSIFVGAGASYGCGYTDINQAPPLGKELFDKLVEKYPETWGKHIPKELIKLFKSDFEQGLACTWERQPTFFSHLLTDMGVYFTYFDPPDIQNDLYTSLVKSILYNGLLPKCGFISLNYECIFEIAVCKRVGIKITMNGNYPEPGELLMWKPHGSCNFIPADAPVYNLTLQTTSSKQHYYDGEVKVFRQIREVRNLYLKKNYATPPVISLYVPGKATLSAPRYIEQVRKNMKSWVINSDYIITIGVRPNLADKHIWEPILLSKAKVWYVGGEDENMENIKKKLGNNRFEFISKTFEEAIDRLKLRISLLH